MRCSCLLSCVPILTMLGLTGCCINKASTFAVANESGQGVSVSYSFPVGEPCPDRSEVFVGLVLPREVQIEDLVSINRSERVADYVCDARKGELRLSLPQGRAVALFRSLTQGCASRVEPIDSISVVSPLGARSASGIQIRGSFEKYDSDLYVFHFK